MDPRRFATSFALTIAIGLLVVVASATGLLVDGLYRNTLWATSQFRGSDLVRLVVVVPVLVGSLVLARRGSTVGFLVWLGVLWLTVYDYAFYLFGAAFNELFLVYVALFTLSILALVFALPLVDARWVAARFRAGTPARPVAAYLAFVALFLGGLWTAQTVVFVVTGEPPASLVASGHLTEVVFALDLSLLVPALALAAVWLWRRQPWGYVLGAMLLVKGTLYPVALLGMGLFMARAGLGDEAGMTVFWAFFAIASAGAAFAMFRGLDGRGVVMQEPGPSPHRST